MAKHEGHFEGEYEVEDGYVGPSAPQYFTVSADDLEEGMSDEDLEDLYAREARAHFDDNIYPSTRRLEEFVSWARERLAEKQSSETEED